MSSDIERFLYQGSPFLPEVDQEVLDDILNAF